MSLFTNLGLRGVIFDMDGLLFDTERLYMKGWVAVGERMNLPITEEVAHQTIGIADVGAERLFRDHYDPAFTMEAALPLLGEWLTRHIETHGMPLKPGARELVTLLHERGIPFALGTSNRKVVVDAYLEAAGLDGYFRTIVTADMVEAVKPAPDIFLKAAALLGLAPGECLVLEDSIAGVTAAHAAGCRPAMVPDLLVPTDEARAKAWRVFESLEEASGVLF